MNQLLKTLCESELIVLRKILAFLFALCFVVMAGCSSNSGQSSVDPASMDTESLKELYQSVRNEMVKRGEISDEENRIGRGTYEVGRDIKAGSYDFLCDDTDYFDDESPDNDIYIFMTGEDGGDRENRIFWEQRFQIGSHVTFNLEEGMTLTITGCSGILKENSPSWAP